MMLPGARWACDVKNAQFSAMICVMAKSKKHATIRLFSENIASLHA
jgi:hypothetical protein